MSLGAGTHIISVWMQRGEAGRLEAAGELDNYLRDCGFVFGVDGKLVGRVTSGWRHHKGDKQWTQIIRPEEFPA